MPKGFHAMSFDKAYIKKSIIQKRIRKMKTIFFIHSYIFNTFQYANSNFTFLDFIFSLDNNSSNFFTLTALIAA